MRIVYTLSLFLVLLAPRVLNAQVFKIYDNFSELEERIAQAKGNTLLVINFWATFCKPCVKELPYFNELHHKYASSDFEVILVSLDFKSQLEKKFIPFLRSTPLAPEIILMSDQNTDGWIPRVQPDWNGTIPVTLLVRGAERDFHEGEFESYTDLENFIQRFFERIGEPSPIPAN
jgi:thiol-disulfide isomerase/thioredoxin